MEQTDQIRRRRIESLQVMIISLGEVLVDRIANEFSRDIASIRNWSDFPGGAPANVACALRRLGRDCAFLGAIGNDEVGDRLLSTLAHYAVNLSLVQRCDAPTRQVYVTRDEKGDRNFAGFGNQKSSTFADTQLQYRELGLHAITQASFLYLGSLMLAQSSCRAAVDQYVAFAQSHSIPCFMDVNWRPMFWENTGVAKDIILERLPYIHFLKLSKEEAAWLFETQSPQNICDRFHHLQGIFITDGDKGCHYQLFGFSGMVPAFRVNVVDTTGAGDAFVAGCLHQLMESSRVQTDKDAENIVRYANAVGALTTEQLGAIADHPNGHDIMRFLQKHNGGMH